MKTAKVLKIRHFIVMAMCFFALSASAQLKVAANGYTTFANTNSPLSPISVGYGVELMLLEWAPTQVFPA